MKFSNTYISLGEDFYEKVFPIPVKDPKLFLWNASLAEQLRVADDLKNDLGGLARAFCGNDIISGSEPIAMAYAGHQFGNFVPQLGDGRAHLLGEVINQNGQRLDVQLKGSGRTYFSRGGDGRCALGPALREFIMSEAMHALGVPTTRCLSVVSTGEDVFRESPLPGAVVTRIASSHLRVGTFQYFASRGERDNLKFLCNYTVERHFPELLKEEGPHRYILLLDKVIEGLVNLVVEWMRVGFIHGVMNTDNTSICGETIYYGPCSMIGTYDPNTVYSSIDRMGRYAFGRQPEMMQWNLLRFAECLLPLVDDNAEKAIKQIEPIVVSFSNRFQKSYEEMMGKKLGFVSYQEADQKLLLSILDQIQKNQLDYTITFDRLTKSLSSQTVSMEIKKDLEDCYEPWLNRVNSQKETSQEVQKIMRRHNPVLIPRNHHVENILRESADTGKEDAAEKFLQALRSPYEELDLTAQYQDPPSDGDKSYQTFCGT